MAGTVRDIGACLELERESTDFAPFYDFLFYCCNEWLNARNYGWPYSLENASEDDVKIFLARVQDFVVGMDRSLLQSVINFMLSDGLEEDMIGKLNNLLQSLLSSTDEGVEKICSDFLSNTH